MLPPPPRFFVKFFFTFLHFYFHVIIPSFSPFPKHSHFCYTLRIKKIPDYTTIYQDEQIVVLNKRSGLLIASDRYDLEAPRLDLEAEKEFGKLYAVHRIDKDTSGIIIYARNPEAHKALSMQFQEREVEKTYHCLVHGHPLWTDLTVNLPLANETCARIKKRQNRKTSGSALKWLVYEKRLRNRFFL